jgi:SAM-dependent methyltransferase
MNPAPAPGASAFDAISGQYDTLFSPETNPLVAMLRARVYQTCARHFPVGSRLLELGCGTGEDTLALTERGHKIVAVDPAPGMIAKATAKLTAAGRADAVTFVNAGAGALGETWPSLGLSVDGAFSNFAPLNCELSLDPVRVLLERALRPGARFLGVVLPRVCPLEIALFLARGQPRAALRRFQRAPVADVEGRRFPMRYYGAADFDRALGAGFRRVELKSLGIALPPISFGPQFARVPGLLPALSFVEDRLNALPGLRGMGDHIALVYERVAG